MPAVKGKDNSQQKSSPTKENDTGCKKRRTPQGPRGQSQSCHQCRQSIYSSKGASELKLGQQRVKCSQCTRYWCEKCLNNRYGLERNEINLSLWVCPVCANNCNCSLCRKKSGKLATGILTPLAKNAGFSSVSEFLQKGTDDIAKCLQWQQSPLQPIKRTLSSSDDISTSKRRKLCHSQYNITMNDDNEWVEESNNFVTKDDHTHSIIKDKIPTSSSTRQLRSRTIHPLVTSRKTRSCKAVTKQLKCEPEPLQDQDEVSVETNKCLPNMVDEKQEELIKLKMSVICKIKEEKIQQKIQDKIERQRRRLEKRQKLLKDKEMKRLTNMRLHKAKLLLKEARHHDKQRHKQMSELKKLMIKKQQERHLKTKLMREPLSILPDSSSSLMPFTPLSPLPNYPLLEVGVAQKFIPALLFVCEYLYTFTDIQINAASLVVALEKSPGHVFKSLLNLLLQCTNNKVPDVNDCNAEEISNQILLQIGYNEDTENTTTVEARIQHLTSLCYATLETASMGDVIKESIATSVQEKKKLRAKRQDLTKQITDELKKLCDEGASIEELTAKRNEFSEQIQDIHQATPSYNKIRRLPLGQDRNNRLYWQLVSVPGIVVEDGTIWSIINNSDLLDQVLMSLQVSDVEEKKLYNNLKALQKNMSF